MSKKEISKEFARLRDFGFDVWNYNEKKPLRRAQSGFVDHHLMSYNYDVYIEVKLPGDKYRDRQEDLAKKISHLSTTNKAIHYRLVRSLADAKRLVDLLLERKL